MVNFDRKMFCILGLPFDAISMSETLDQIRTATVNRSPCFISTPNLNFLIACLSDKAFRDSVIESDISIADGMPIIWISKFLGLPIAERVAGSDLFEKLNENHESALKVYFFGGMEGVAERAFSTINSTNKGLIAVGFQTPGFGSVEEMSSQDCLDRINAAEADFLVVALGARKGQAWIQFNKSKLNVPVISHLGAVVNFVAGNIKRAPNFLQIMGFEWLWRIYQEPTLWSRYYYDGIKLFQLFFTRILPYKLWLIKNKQLLKEDQVLMFSCEVDNNKIKVYLSGNCVFANLDPLRTKIAELVNEYKYIEFDLLNVKMIDSAFIGLSILLSGCLAKLGGRFSISNINAINKKIIYWNCAEFLLD